MRSYQDRRLLCIQSDGGIGAGGMGTGTGGGHEEQNKLKSPAAAATNAFHNLVLRCMAALDCLTLTLALTPTHLPDAGSLSFKRWRTSQSMTCSVCCISTALRRSSPICRATNGEIGVTTWKGYHASHMVAPQRLDCLVTDRTMSS